MSDVEGNLDIISALVEKSGFLKSNGEARRSLKENSISVNKEKVNDEFKLSNDNLINNKYILLQRGKKNYFVLIVE
jgi:tyrosyl-tRNA synthetase